MKTLDEVSEYTLWKVSRIYKHPRMFYWNADGIVMALWCLHDIWGVVNGRVDEFYATLDKVRQEENCGPNSLETHFRLHFSVDHGPSEAEVIDYVILQYQRIDEILGIRLPDNDIRKRSAEADTAGFLGERPGTQVLPRPKPESGAGDGNS
jgi:hypothetical protein